MKAFYSTITTYCNWFGILLLLILLSGGRSFAQCPSNLGFEDGTFNGWQCWTGTTTVGPGNVNQINLTLQPGPVANRHTMLSSFPPGNGMDPYGNFPQNCPNGSGHSIKLGNNQPGAQAEGVSYTYTIPAGVNNFNLIYYYAVVFQGPPHQDYQQPRMVIEIKNLTDNVDISCSSFNFFYSTSSPNLPGFFLSPNPGSATPVWCKDWSANSVKLDNLAGKTIQLFFKTADCTPTGHFGYAYIDVNTECSSSFVGATYCHDDAFVNVSAPYGYQTYTWWDATFSNIIGNTQTLNFTPPPPPGTQINVVIDPYNGFGCRDTLYANLYDTLTIHANAGHDTLSCNNAPVQLGELPKAGYVYSWDPPAELSNPHVSNPIASPSTTTQYVVTVMHEGGGCVSTDTVIVKAAVLDNSIQIAGPTMLCADGSQTTILTVHPADSIQWYRNGVAIPGSENQTSYNVLQTGAYNATVFSHTGCSLGTFTYNITVDPKPNAGFTASAQSQCFKNNQFSFTNTSTVVSGTMTYEWDLGDGFTATTTDVIHSYMIPGIYSVRLITTTDKGCKDTSTFAVNVYATPVAGFTISSIEQCQNSNQFVFTNTSTVNPGTLHYNWDLGDGNTASSKDVTHSYTLPGTYLVKLLIITDNGCQDSLTLNVHVNPEPHASFAVNNAQQCFTNNQFIFTDGSSVASGSLQYAWSLGDGSTETTANVTHNYGQPGDYLVKLVTTTDKGCTDDSSFMVKVFPYAAADFTAQPVCTNLNLPLINKTTNNTGTTLNYLWDFGNGQTSTLKNPVYSYATPGTYTITLSVNTNQCPQPTTTMKMDIVIDAPAPGINYPVKDAVMNYPETLEARQIGTSVFWSPGISLDNRLSYKPAFKGINPQLYTIQLKTLSGCVTIDTQMVKTHKKIEIYVPTAFTPGTNGLNDYLRPVLMGFDHVNYFRVYNRWGKLLFQMKNDRPGWDGKVNNIPQEMQTVIWMIEAVDVDGNVHTKQGTTILMR